MQGSLFKVVFILLVLGIVNTLMHGVTAQVGPTPISGAVPLPRHCHSQA
jgi:hypothetical protein